jgi:hypothetical protein
MRFIHVSVVLTWTRYATGKKKRLTDHETRQHVQWTEVYNRARFAFRSVRTLPRVFSILCTLLLSLESLQYLPSASQSDLYSKARYGLEALHHSKVYQITRTTE